MGFQALLQGIFPTQGWNLQLLCLLHLQVGSLLLAPPGKPIHTLPYIKQVINKDLLYSMASLEAQLVKNLPAMQETQVRSLSREDPLEEEMETHFSILAWKIPWTEELRGLHTVHGVAKSHN